MYRLLLEVPDFDLDLDDPKRQCMWLHECETGKCLEMILRNELRFFSLSLEARFEIVIQLNHRLIDCARFLDYIGLRHSDPRLASLSCSKGSSVLHYVAKRLGLSRGFEEPEAWLDMGVSVLKNDADPSSIAIIARYVNESLSFLSSSKANSYYDIIPVSSQLTPLWTVVDSRLRYLANHGWPGFEKLLEDIRL